MEKIQSESRKKRNKRRKLAAIILIVVIAAVLGLLWNIPLSHIEIVGANIYSAEDIEKIIFPKEKDKRLLPFLLFGRKSSDSMLLIQSYEVEFTSWNSVRIQVYEKGVVGSIYDTGAYFSFDRNGYVVDSRMEPFEDVPVIEGIEFTDLVLYQPIDAKGDPELFSQIMRVTQLIREKGLQIDRVRFRKDGSISLYSENVEIYLGMPVELEGKVQELKNLWDNLSGKSGILYLDTYVPGAVNPEYRFVNK